MTQEKSNLMWGGRFAAAQDDLMEEINASIDFDKRLAEQDILASKVHAKMLSQQNIISKADYKSIITGLEQIESQIKNNKFVFDRALEDIHMNVEARLNDIIGAPAGRLHTARSRNDQVATDFRLWVRDQIDLQQQLLKSLIEALLNQAELGIDWVMPGFTHLQIAQPVTWGHHMMAYVEMFGSFHPGCGRRHPQGRGADGGELRVEGRRQILLLARHGGPPGPPRWALRPGDLHLRERHQRH